MNRLFKANGGSAILETEALQRFHCDAHTAADHQSISWDTAVEDCGRQILGLILGLGRYG